LKVVLLFESRGNCAIFLNNLDGYLRHFHLVGILQFDSNFEQLLLSDYPSSVFERDYGQDESDTETYSFAITRMTHMSSIKNRS